MHFPTTVFRETDTFDRRTAKAQFISFVDRSEAWRGINC